MLVITGGLGVAANGKEKCIITLKMHVVEHHMYKVISDISAPRIPGRTMNLL